MAELTQEDRDTLNHHVSGLWVDAAMNADWEKSLAICSDDISYLPPDSPPLHGKDPMREFMVAFPAIHSVSQSIVKMWGDTSLVAAEFEISVSMDGEDGPVSLQGKGIGTASKDSGEWLWTSSCFNWNG